jgi:hypothetical protein
MRTQRQEDLADMVAFTAVWLILMGAVVAVVHVILNVS